MCLLINLITFIIKIKNIKQNIKQVQLINIIKVFK